MCSCAWILRMITIVTKKTYINNTFILNDSFKPTQLYGGCKRTTDVEIWQGKNNAEYLENLWSHL